MNKKIIITIWITILLLTAGFKIILLLGDVFPFNSDEAVVGLMAKHILDGERPIFFYGQAYMGSLDAWLTAGGFAVLGEKVWVIRLVQVLLYLATVTLTMYFVWLYSNSAWPPVITGLFMAFPVVNMMLYTTVSLGGYGESLLFGTLLLVVYTLYLKKETGSFASLGLLTIIGLISGFGFWVNGITLVYSLPVIGLIFWHLRDKDAKQKSFKNILTKFTGLILGLLIGLIPWILYVSSNGLAVIISENIGKVVDVSGESYLFSLLLHLRNLVLFGVTAIFGIRPPWGLEILAKPILPLAVVAWILIFYLARKHSNKDQAQELFRLISLVILVLVLGFIFTPFGNDPSGRYFIPVVHMLAILAGYTLGKLAYKPLLPGVLSVVILAFNIWGVVECAWKNPPGLTTQFDPIAQVDHRYDEDLIDFLLTYDEKAGFSNYWVSYPLAFLSNEEIIFVPELPYHQDFRHTTRDNRYPAYSETVLTSEKVAYITTNHPQLNERIRNGFYLNKITWKEKLIGDYMVFYSLSGKVLPDDLDLGLIE